MQSMKLKSRGTKIDYFFFRQVNKIAAYWEFKKSNLISRFDKPPFVHTLTLRTLLLSPNFLLFEARALLYLTPL